MKTRLAGWSLIALSLCCFSIHLPIFASAAHLGNVAPAFPVGYLAVASFIVPFGLGLWLVLRRN